MKDPTCPYRTCQSELICHKEDSSSICLNSANRSFYKDPHALDIFMNIVIEAELTSPSRHQLLQKETFTYRTNWASICNMYNIVNRNIVNYTPLCCLVLDKQNNEPYIIRCGPTDCLFHLAAPVCVYLSHNNRVFEISVAALDPILNRKIEFEVKIFFTVLVYEQWTHILQFQPSYCTSFAVTLSSRYFSF